LAGAATLARAAVIVTFLFDVCLET